MRSVTRSEAVEVSRRLWEQSFPDEGDYTDFYFSRRCSENVVLCLHETDGAYVSAFQLFPYDMKLAGKNIGMLYMSGVCTRPDMRGKGEMSACIKKNLSRMTGGDAAFVLLIPATEGLFGYYRHFGFVEASARRIVEYDAAEQCFASGDLNVEMEDIPYGLMQEEHKQRLYGVFRQYWEMQQNVVMHHEEDFRTVLDAYAADNLRVVMGYMPHEKAKPVMAAVFSDRRSEVFVHDWAAVGGRDAEHFLFRYLWRRFAALSTEDCKNVGKPLRMFSYTDSPFTMARVLNAGKAIEFYSETNGYAELGVHLSDGLLAGNSGFYFFRSGHVAKTCTPLEGVTYRDMTVGELAGEIFGHTELRASFMLDY